MTAPPVPAAVPDGSVTAVAPAKVNLHLAVGDARADGFHELVTVYQAVDMWERVRLSRAEHDQVTVSGPDHSLVPTDAGNLALRAVVALRRECGVDQPVAVHIDKGVPVAGGMAGGSADAAAALVAAERLLGCDPGREALYRLAAELGSDVPFCLHGGTVLGTGRGEELTPLLRVAGSTHLVVATARGGLSTPEVFAELDRLRAAGEASRLRPPDDVVEALALGDQAGIAAAVGNDLQSAALSLRPELRHTLRAGTAAGATAALISGSGPTCLLLCPDRPTAIDVAARLAESGLAREVRVTSGPVPGAHVVDDPDPAGT